MTDDHAVIHTTFSFLEILPGTRFDAGSIEHDGSKNSREPIAPD